MPAKKRRLLSFVLCLLVIIGAGAIFLKLTSKPAKADWYSESWAYRKAITFTHNAALSNQRVTITLTNTNTLVTNGKLQSTCNDLRFTDANGVLLQYGSVTNCNTSSTTVDVVYTTINNGSNLSYVYYGNPAAVSGATTVSGYPSLTPNGSITVGSETIGPGPALYYPFNEGQGTTTNDATVYNNVGTLTNSPTWESEDQCISGKCLGFSGNSDYITTATSTAISPVSGLTVEGWVKMPGGFSTSSSGNMGIVDKGDYQFYLDQTDGRAHWVVNDSTAKALSALSNGVDNSVTAMAVYKGNLYLGGTFLNICGNSACNSGNVSANRIAMWNGTSFSVVGSGTGVNGTVSAMVVYKDNLYIGGAFTAICADATCTAGTTTANHIASWNGSTYSTVGAGPGFSGNVSAMAVYSGNLYIGGAFASISPSTTANDIAKWDGTSLTTVGAGPGFSGSVNSFGVYNGNLYIGGAYVSICGNSACNASNTTANRISKWDGSTLTTVGAGPGFNGDVDALATFNGTFYIGGAFLAICADAACTSGTTTANRLAKWNGSTLSTMGSGPGVNSTVNVFTQYDGVLYLGGAFNVINGATTNNFIAKWDGSTISTVGSGPGFSSSVTGMADYNGDLVLGGAFQNICGNAACNSGNTAANRMAKLGTSANKAISSANTSSFTAGTWYHLAGTYDGSNLNIYVNGQVQGSIGSAPSSLGAQSLALLIGKTYGAQWAGGSGEQLNGFLDELKIYPYARSAAQIQADYSARGVSKGDSTVLGTSDQNLSALNNGLIGYWKMDESSGNISDSSGNSTTLLNQGTATFATGKFGNSSSLNGTSQYFCFNVSSACGASSSTYNLTSGVTTSAWVFLTSTSEYDAIITETHDNGQTGYDFGVDHGKLSMFINNVGDNTTAAVPTNTWTLLTWTYDGKNVTGYINGSQAIQVAASTLSASSPWLGVGARFQSNNSASGFFHGNIDEARIYNRALSASEVQQLYNWAPGPVGWWKLDDAAGSTAVDSSGHGNNGTAVDSSTESTDNSPLWRNGKYGGAIGSVTNATFAHGPINAGNVSAFDLGTTGSITVEAWIYPTTTSQGSSGTSQGYVLSKQTTADTNAGYSIEVFSTSAGGDICFNVADGTHTYNPCTASNAYVANTWYHVVGVFDRKSAANSGLYINGVLSTNVANSGALDPTAIVNAGNSTPFYIAHQQNVALDDFAGNIDDVRVYNYARKPKQIVADMNGGHPTGGSPLGSQDIYWKFDEQQGTTANNSGFSGNTNKGTLNNSPVWQLPNSCKVNGCLSFSGSTMNVSGGNIADLNGTATDSATFWINPTSLAVDKAIVSKWDNSTKDSLLIATDHTSSSEMRVYIASSPTDTGSNYLTTVGLGLTASTWQHIAVVYDASSSNRNDWIKVYKNGLRIPAFMTGTIPYGIAVSTSNLKVGASDSGTYTALNALIDEVKIYPGTSLNQSDINIDMNNGSAVAAGGVLGTHDNEGTDNGGAQPVALWKLNDNTGTSAVDSSGNGLTGTLTSGPVWVPGKIGNGVSFNSASSQYISVNDNSVLDITGDITVEAWAYPTNVNGSFQDVVFKGTTTSNSTRQYGLRINSSNRWQVFYDIGSSEFNVGGVAASAAIANQWAHLVWTRASGVSKLYLNGVQVDTQTQAGSINSTANILAIGRIGQANAEYFNGTIDQVKIYNYARSAAQVNYDMNRGAPVAWYKFDECAGPTAHDSSVNAAGQAGGADGTITIGGTGTYTTAGTCNSGTATEAWNAGSSGKINSSLGLDGSNDYVSVSSPAYETLTTGSLSMWINMPTYSGTATAIAALSDKNTSAQNEFQFTVNGTGSGRDYGIELAEIKSSSVTTDIHTANNIIPTSSWANLVFTQDGTGLKLYVNGIFYPFTDGSTNDWFGAVSNLNNFTMGAILRSSSPVIPWKGLIDDVRIYNYALNTTQIGQLYNGGAAQRFAPVTGTP